MYAPAVFVDESKARGYLLVAASVNSADLTWIRKHVKTLHLPRQRRLHFTTESKSHREAILRRLAETGVSAIMYDASAYCNEKAARNAAISRMVDDTARIGATLLIVERDDSTLATDRSIIQDCLIRTGCQDTLRYEHLRAHEECLLALPDAIAWCWARGGQWRQRVKSLVTEVVTMQPGERPEPNTPTIR
jgi:hypothetical protein